MEMDKRTTPIRVLQVCEHFGNNSATFHGVARSFELWLPALNHPPFEVLLCSRAPVSAAALERYRKAGVEPMALGYGKLDPRNLYKLMRLIREHKIDILHLHGYGACTWGRLAGHLMGIPVIVHERCNYHTVPWFQRPVEYLLGPLTRHAFAVSESTRQFTIRKRHIPDDRVKLLYSGIPLTGIPHISEDERRRVRKERGVADDVFLLGVAGRLEPHKGHADVFAALAQLRPQLPGLRLWIIGDGYHEEDLKRLAAEAGVGDLVEFLGYQADIWPLIQALDVQVFPSHREGTPNTLYEAMAIGAAIAASTADGQGEILTDGRDALLFEPGDSTALAAHIRRLHDDPALRERLKAAALLRIRDFDMDKTLDVLRQTYRGIMETHA